LAVSRLAFSVPETSEKLLSTENVNSTKCGVTLNVTANYYSGPGSAVLVPDARVVATGDWLGNGTSFVTGGRMYYVQPGKGSVEMWIYNNTMNSTTIDYTTGTVPV
jgi:hypothetical protein